MSAQVEESCLVQKRRCFELLFFFVASGVDISQQISFVADKTHVSIGRPRMIVKPGDGLMALGWDYRFDVRIRFLT